MPKTCAHAPWSVCAVVACAVTPGLSLATEIRWIDSSGGLFTDGANWENGQTPTPSQDAVFDLDGTFGVHFDADATTAAMLVRDGFVDLDIGSSTFRTNRLEIGSQSGDAAVLRIKRGSLGATSSPSPFFTAEIGTDAVGDGALIITGPNSEAFLPNDRLDIGSAARPDSENLRIENGATLTDIPGALRVVQHGGRMTVTGQGSRFVARRITTASDFTIERGGFSSAETFECRAEARVAIDDGTVFVENQAGVWGRVDVRNGGSLDGNDFVGSGAIDVADAGSTLSFSRIEDVRVSVSDGAFASGFEYVNASLLVDQASAVTLADWVGSSVRLRDASATVSIIRQSGVEATGSTLAASEFTDSDVTLVGTTVVGSEGGSIGFEGTTNVTADAASSFDIGGDLFLSFADRVGITLDGLPGGGGALFSVAGDAFLGGELSLDLANATPTVGSFIPLVTAASIAGDFSTLDLPSLPAGRALQPERTSTSFGFRVIPAPGSTGVAIILGAMGATRRRR